MLANKEEETWTDTMTFVPGEVRTEEKRFVDGEDIELYRFRSKTEDDYASAEIEVIHYELH